MISNASSKFKRFFEMAHMVGKLSEKMGQKSGMNLSELIIITIRHAALVL